MKTRQLAALSLLSVALIAYQLILMQLFSLTQWHHFAYMIIAVALLGFGASGTVISLFRNSLLQRFELLFPLLCWACAAVMAMMPVLSRMLLSDFDSYLLFVEKRQFIFLLLTDLFYFLPFFLGALAIGLVFVRDVEKIGKLYFANLIGSGSGGIVAILLMWQFHPETLPAVTAVFALIAGFCVWPVNRTRLGTCTAGLAFILIGYSLLSPLEPHYSQYKDISYALNLPDARITATQPGPYGLLQLLSSPALRFGSGLSLAFPGEIPAWPVLYNNGHRFGAVVPWPVDEKQKLWDYRCEALPYVLRDPQKVLILQAGSGSEIAQALSAGAEQVTATETHRNATNLLKSEALTDTSKLFSDPRVELLNLQPRAALAFDEGKYALITLPRLGSFGGGTGLFALQEEYHLTREAFGEMWQHLADDGMIRTSSWLDFPLRRPLKLLATLVEMLKDAGVSHPQRHLIAIRDWGSVSFIVKKTPFTSTELTQVRNFCHELQFDPLFLPDLKPAERVFFHQPESNHFFRPFDLIINQQQEQLLRNTEFNLSPATDDKPFFSRFLRWQSLPQLADPSGRRSIPFMEMGYLIVLVTLIQMTLAATILILLPLLRLGWHARNKWRTAVYFSSLGLGYMFFEIVLIHKLVLYLGEPIFAAAAGIAILLILSGIGSFFSTHFTATSRALKKVTLLVFLLLSSYVLLLPYLLNASMDLPMVGKSALALLLIIPPAIVMGIPFPLGLRCLAVAHHEQIAWAWGINGCVSVLSTSIATIIAVEFGFSAVMLVAATAYLLAALSRPVHQ